MSETEAKVPERIWMNPDVAEAGGFADPAFRDDGDVEYVPAASRDEAVREALAEALAIVADERTSWRKAAEIAPRGPVSVALNALDHVETRLRAAAVAAALREAETP